MISPLILQSAWESTRPGGEGALDATLPVAPLAVHLLEWWPTSRSLRWLAASETVFGHATREHPNLDAWLAHVHPADRERLNEAFCPSEVRVAQPGRWSFRLQDAQGGWRALELQVARRAVAEGPSLGCVVDISATHCVQELSQLSVGILDAMGDAVVVVDEAGHIRVANRRYAELFGYVRSDLVGRPLSTLSRDGPEEFERRRREIVQAVEQRGVWQGRLDGYRRDGTRVPTDATVTALSTRDERVWILVRRDISDRLELEAEVLRSARTEQARLGSDLHDAVGQQIVGAAMLTAALATDLRHTDPAAAAQAGTINALLREAVDACRSVARGLLPFVIEEQRLDGALRELAQRTEASYGVHCTVRSAAGVALPSGNAAYHLYMIAREAVANAVRHGRPTSIEIALDSADAWLRMQILDDGECSLVQTQPTDGCGRRIMRYRARAIDATIEWRAREPTGNRVMVSVPPSERVESTPARHGRA